jgi:uncharacterized protein (DUF58 family)
MPETTKLTAKELFDPAFLESLRRLHILARRVARGGRPAEQRSKGLGAGIEFQDFRPYTPGDDFRSIDWKAYQRLGKVFLRLYEEHLDLPVYLLVDRSRSLFEEDPPRIQAGLRCALALASISLNQHDSVGLFPFAEDLQIALRPRSGRARLHRFAEALTALEPGGATDFARSLRTFSALGLRQGLVVIVSDFFDPLGADAVVDAVKRLPHRILLVRLLRETDAEPRLGGDFQLNDCESGESQDVSATPAILDAYREAYRRFDATLTGYVRKRGAGLLVLDTDQPVIPQLASLFEGGAYTP